MTLKKRSRIIFFSKEDGAAGPNLHKAEELLKAIDFKYEFGIKDILEFYHVKQYFDNELYLLNWTQEDITFFKKVVEQTWAIVKKNMLEINNSNIIDNLAQVNYSYIQSFWQLIDLFAIYKKIDKETFVLILNNSDRNIYDILSSSNIVKQFNLEIKEFLLCYSGTAELLISSIEEKDRSAHKLYFPKSLGVADMELIISNYLNSPQANLNYVRLIVSSRDTPEFKLAPKVRLKAKKKSEELNNQIIENGYSWSEGVQIAIAKDQSEPIKMSHKGNNLGISYSEKYLDDQTGSVPLFNVFANLFHYTDQQGLIRLVSLDSELDVLEKTLMKSKNEYLIGSEFIRKNHQSQLQLLLYNGYLKSRDISVEKLVESYIDDLLRRHFQITNFRFNFPSINSSYLEKIRILAPEFEFMLRQYQTFVDEGEIDFDLLELQSNPVRFSEVRSLCNKKYIYIKDDKMLRLKHQFFSNQSMLHYVEPYKSKCRNLYQLLTKEDVSLEQFKNYQIDAINNLVEEGFLYITDSGIVKIKKQIFVFLLGELFKNEVLSYWNYPSHIRDVIDEMINKDLVFVQNKLFTKQEQQYLNFYLNKKEFTNGLDLRNKYLHGTNSPSEDSQKHDYYLLLKLLILALLKIKDDLVSYTYH